MNKILFWFTTIFFLIINGSVSSQQLLAPAGDTFCEEDLNISWSIGETLISTYQLNDSIYLTQGFQQPLLICSPCDEEESNRFIDLTKETGERQAAILWCPIPQLT